MPTATEIFINAELPKRPYTNQFPFTAGHVPVATGVGLQVEARALTISDISDMTGLWNDRGAYTVNAAGNIAYPSSAGSGVAGALMKGDIFTVAGAVAGVSTINNIAVNNGDTVRALVDNPSDTDNAHWAIAENNIGYVPENRANKTTDTDLSGAAGTYPDTPTVKSYIDNYDISAASINSTGMVTLTRTESDLTFQVPTAVSGLSFDPNTGVLTSSYTNNATSTTITVAANEVSDNVFRIKDNDDATKKIAFEASGIATGQTRTITMPNLDIDLGKIGLLTSSRITPTDSGSITLQSNKLYHVYQPSGGITSYTFILPSAATSGDIIEIHDSGNNFAATTTLIFRANKTFLFPQGISASVSGSAPNIEWTDTRRATNKRWKFTYYSDYGGFWLVEELGVGGAGSPELSAMRKANSSVGVVHNIDAVSGTNKTITYPNRDVDLGLVGQTDFLDTAFRISDNLEATKKIAFQSSGITAGQTRTINMPDFDVDLNKAVYRKDISMSVALSSLRAGDEIDLTTSLATVSMQHSDTFSTVKGYYFNNNTQNTVTFTLSRTLGSAPPTTLTNIDGVTGEILSSQDFTVTTTPFDYIISIPRYGRLLISPGSSGQVRLVVYSPQSNSISTNNSLWCESTTLAGTHNTAIKCKDLKIHANQKFGRFEDLWGFPLTSQLPGATNPADGILVPIGTKMRGFKGNSIATSTSGARVEAVFTRTVAASTGQTVIMRDSDGITPYSHMARWSGSDPFTEHYITLRKGNAYSLLLVTVGPNSGSGAIVGSTTLHSVGILPAVSASISDGRLVASFTTVGQAYYSYEIRSVYGVDL